VTRGLVSVLCVIPLSIAVSALAPSPATAQTPATATTPELTAVQRAFIRHRPLTMLAAGPDAPVDA